MAKQIARLLKTDVMADIDIPAIAQFLQSQGRRGDTILAHINAKEAEMLRKMGGAEERNPVTGLPEYFSIEDYGSGYGADYDQSVANNNARLADADINFNFDSEEIISVKWYGFEEINNLPNLKQQRKNLFNNLLNQLNL